MNCPKCGASNTFEPASQHDVAKPRREFFLHPYAVWESQRADPHDRRIDFGRRRGPARIARSR